MIPLVSVCVRSYNQEQYIVQAIESVLMQHTSFEFEVVIFDDHSTDSSSSELMKLQTRDSRVRLFFNDKNEGGPRTLRKAIEKCESKYLAFLDGDDYYTDTYKLQKQVDYLEGHPDFAACFHNVLNIYEGSSRPPSLFLPLDFPSYHDCVSIISKKWFLPIHSVVLRREYVFFPEWYEAVMNDDFVINLAVALHGPYHYLSEIMAVYRHHKNNISNCYTDQVLIDTQLRTILTGFREIYPEQYQEVFNRRIRFYDDRIAFNKREESQPWRKFFRIKTYKRFIKRVLREKVGGW